MNTYHHLSPKERALTMMLLLADNTSIRRITKAISMHPFSVSREIKRKRNRKSKSFYCATHATKGYRKRRKQSVKLHYIGIGSRLFKQLQFWRTHNKCSPEQMTAMLKVNLPSDQTIQVNPEMIYAHIYAQQPKGGRKN